MYAIDLDFGGKAREEVMEYVINEHGRDNVCALGTYQYVWAKGAIRDIGKVLGIPLEETDKIAKKIDGSLDFKEVMELGVIDNYKKQYPELFQYCEKLSGLPKSFGIHACFTENNLVNTINGYKKIKDIEVGDSVLTHKNRYKPVLKTSKNIGNDIYSLRTMSNYNIEATGNHPVLVKKRVPNIKERKYYEQEWTRVDEINKLDVVGYPINTKETEFSYKNLPTNDLDFWWIVGCYLGDGWLKTRKGSSDMVEIACNKNEYQFILQKAKKIFQFVHYSKKETTTNVVICSNELHEFLKNFGKYAENKFIPQFVIDLPVVLLEQFLNGYLFADGYYSERNDNYSFSTTSKKLANTLRDCVMKVYKTPLSIFERKAQKYKIEGRIVNGKKQWRGSFYKSKRQRKTWFVENDIMWIPVYHVKKTDKKEYVYNLTVLDDSSYIVEGMIVHNCGRVISNYPIMSLSAVDLSEEMPTLMLDMHEAEDLGMVKFDFLGVKTIDVIYDTLEMIGKTYDYIAPHNIDFEDKNVWNNFKSGNTNGVFQFSSDGMKSTLTKMGADNMETLIAANALYRPGSMAYIQNYIDRKNGEEEITYIHDDLKPILNVTYGIITYQEQLIEVGRLAGLENPDKLRKATAKKNPKLMAEVKPELKKGLLNRGWMEDTIEELWDIMVEFSKYSLEK